MNIKEVLIQLSNVGIEAELIDESEYRIFGGKPNKTELGFSFYSQPFSIFFDKENWILTTTGKGQLDNVEKFNTLDEAINKLYSYYA